MPKSEARRCKTPGARYRTQITDAIAIRVSSVDGIALTEAEAIRVERELHDAVEKIIAPFWKRSRLPSSPKSGSS